MNIKTVGIISLVAVGSFIGGFKTCSWVIKKALEQQIEETYVRSDNKSLKCKSRRDAEEALDLLIDSLSSYGNVTVSDLYDIGHKTPSFADSKKGWKDLSQAVVQREYTGYTLKLPDPIDLE